MHSSGKARKSRSRRNSKHKNSDNVAPLEESRAPQSVPNAHPIQQENDPAVNAYEDGVFGTKSLKREKDNGQFSSIWSDEATCALVQQICVVLRDQFKSSRNTGTAWRTVADNLNQLGYKLGNVPDRDSPRISSEECKSRWHHISKEARKYKRRLLEEGSTRKPKVITILGESLEQDLLDFIGDITPKPSTQGSENQKSTLNTGLNDEFDDSKEGFQLFPFTLDQQPAATSNVPQPLSQPVTSSPLSNKRHKMSSATYAAATPPSVPRGDQYRHHIRESKNRAIETLLLASRDRSDVRLQISRAIQLLERRTETVVKAVEMASQGRNFDVDTFLSLMDVVVAADEDHF